MDRFLEKEYHPVIEAYISEYIEEEISAIEKMAFEELLVHDDDLRDLTFNAIAGKKLLEQFRKIKFRDAVKKRLNDSFSD
ncbi:MAG: hypothetical protein WD059_08580 [Balneolaceae bacterium]